MYDIIIAAKIDNAIDKAEEIADIVEEVADDVENVAESAANHLPKGKLRDACEYIDKVAEKVEKDAHIAGEALQKVLLLPHFYILILMLPLCVPIITV